MPLLAISVAYFLLIYWHLSRLPLLCWITIGITAGIWRDCFLCKLVFPHNDEWMSDITVRHWVTLWLEWNCESAWLNFFLLTPTYFTLLTLILNPSFLYFSWPSKDVEEKKGSHQSAWGLATSAAVNERF